MKNLPGNVLLQRLLFCTGLLSKAVSPVKSTNALFAQGICTFQPESVEGSAAPLAQRASSESLPKLNVVFKNHPASRGTMESVVIEKIFAAASEVKYPKLSVKLTRHFGDEHNKKRF